VKVPEHLITEDEDHIQGLEPIERLGREARGALRRGVVKHLRHRADPDLADEEAADDTKPSSNGKSKGPVAASTTAPPAS
jgi:hypothetical protein